MNLPFAVWIGAAVIVCLVLYGWCMWYDGYRQGISVLEREIRDEGIRR